MKLTLPKTLIFSALLLSGVNVVSAVSVLTTLTSNLPEFTQDDYMLGNYLIQPFTTGDAASLSKLQISSNSGWNLANTPTVSLLDSGRNIVADFVYQSSAYELVTYSVSSNGGSGYALTAAKTYFIQINGGSGYLNVTTSPSQTGLPNWTIGDGFFTGFDSTASAQSSQILKFSLSGSGQVPEPATGSLLVVGFGFFALARRFKRS
jgi:hypothetical protein